MSNKIRASIPNAVTCMNVASGCVALALAFAGHFDWASIAICAAAMFDFMDGALARLLKAYSPLGKELDSLSDLVSFGVAPAAMVYLLLPAPANYFALAIPVCGALRLAKFNIDTRQTSGFIGLPIPANALFWIGMASFWQHHAPQPAQVWTYAIMVVVVALSMLAPVRLPSLKFHSARPSRENTPRYMVLIITAACVLWLGVPGLAVAIALYFLYGAVLTLGSRKI